MLSLSRRAMLRGLGALVALPALECMPTSRATGGAVRRLLIWHVPNGMPMSAFHPTGEGLGWTASNILAPLEPFRDRLTLPRDLRNACNVDLEPHHARALGLLSGRLDTPWSTPAPAAWSTVDQIAADALGDTGIRSLELGSEGPTPCGEAAAGQVPSCSGYQTISWRAGAALPRETSPRRVFDRLFGDPGESPAARARRVRADQRVVDRIREDAARLQSAVGAEDRQRLDAWFTAIDEVELRLREQPPAPGDACLADAAALTARIDLDAPMSLEAQVDLMGELAVLALRCDRTRVISYMLGNERSNRPFPELGVTSSHHVISHHRGDPTALSQLETIGRWEMERFAALLTRLDAIPDANGTLLDASAVLFCSSVSDPDTHSGDDMPVILAGGGCGALAARGALRQAEVTPLANLHLALLQRLGVDVDRIGTTSTGPLAGL
jgi:hypothetical protein